MSNILYSHRPVHGVSIGVQEQDGKLFLAACFTNDGTSRKGYVHEERIDTFNRKESRNRVAGRLKKALEGKTHGADGKPRRFVITMHSKISAKEFMFAFRLLFKPDPYEQDTTFCNVLEFEGGEFRTRMSADDMWNKIVLMANAIANHGLQENLAKTIEERPEVLEELRTLCGS